MDRKEFDSLPIGSVVSHRNSAHSCTYRKVRGLGFIQGDRDQQVKVGWAVAQLSAPWAVCNPGDPYRVDLHDASACTLVERGVERPSRRELEAKLEAAASYRRGLEHQLATAERKLARAENNVARLRGIILSALGTLGAGKL